MVTATHELFIGKENHHPVLILDDWRNGNAPGFDPVMRTFDPFIVCHI